MIGYGGNVGVTDPLGGINQQGEVGLGAWDPPGVGPDHHDDRELAEGFLGQPADRLLHPAQRLPGGTRQR